MKNLSLSLNRENRMKSEFGIERGEREERERERGEERREREETLKKK